MATVKKTKLNPRCVKHNCEVTIIVPLNKIGNAHGEIWKCEKCKNDCKEIIYTVA